MSFDAQKQWGDRGRLAKLQKARDHLLSQARQPVSSWNRDGKVANALARRAAAAGELRIAVVNRIQRHQQNFGLQAKPLLPAALNLAWLSCSISFLNLPPTAMLSCAARSHA